MTDAMRIERALDIHGWATLHAVTANGSHLIATMRVIPGPVSHVYIDYGEDLTPELLRAVGETFKQWATLAEELGVSL